MGGESGSSNLMLVERWCPNGGGHRGTPPSQPYIISSEASSAMPSSDASDMRQQVGSGHQTRDAASHSTNSTTKAATRG